MGRDDKILGMITMKNGQYDRSDICRRQEAERKDVELLQPGIKLVTSLLFDT